VQYTKKVCRLFITLLSFQFKQQLINHLLAQPYWNLQLRCCVVWLFFFFLNDASTGSSPDSVRIALASFLPSWTLSLGLSRLGLFRYMQTVKSKTSSAGGEGGVLFGAARCSLSISSGFSTLKCPVAVTMPCHRYLSMLSLFF